MNKASRILPVGLLLAAPPLTAALIDLGYPTMGNGSYFNQTIPGIGSYQAITASAVTESDHHTGSGLNIWNPEESAYYLHSFGYLKFDLSSQSGPLGAAHLVLDLSRFSSNSQASTTFTLIALGASYEDTDGILGNEYQDFSGQTGGTMIDPVHPEHGQEAIDWYEQYVANGFEVGSLTLFDPDNPELGSDIGSIDVTDIVNEWIAGTRANYGFAIRPDGGDGRFEIETQRNAPQTSSVGPYLSTVPVPEPSALLLSAFGLAGLLRRQRQGS
ncbi:MAG: PEP-CTERM sorting domain-containing protein [Verrucomicrobiales bacterium]